MSVSEGTTNIIDRLKPLITEGYSIAIFPEGARPENKSGKVMRFHKGAFLIAKELNLDIVPVYFYGLTEIMPKGSALSNGGTMYIGVGQRIYSQKLIEMGDLASQARNLRKHYEEKLFEIHKQIMTVAEVAPIVFDRYIYKGREIENKSSKIIKKCKNYSEVLTSLNSDKPILIFDKVGQGEISLILTKMYPLTDIYCSLSSEEAKSVLKGCLPAFTTNVHVLDDNEIIESFDATLIVVCSEKQNSEVVEVPDAILIKV